MIKKLLEKLKSIEKEIAHERGELSLFALFLREDAENIWDLVVAGPRLDPDSMEDTNYIANKLKSYLAGNELLSISRIVLLDVHDYMVKIINKNWAVSRGGLLELPHAQLLGLPFKNAYIIISKGGKPVSVNVGKRHLRQTV
jgi:hypothetical protein